MANEKELVLPSGAFATLRTVTVLDFMIASRESKSPDEMPLRLINRAVKIDGKKLTFEQFCELDTRDYFQISSAMSEYISGPVKA